MTTTDTYWTEARRCARGWELECSWCGIIGTTATEHSADTLLLAHTRRHERGVAS